MPDYAAHVAFEGAGCKNAGYVIEGKRDAFSRFQSSDRSLSSICEPRAECDRLTEGVVTEVEQRGRFERQILLQTDGSPEKGCPAHPDFVTGVRPMIIIS